MDELIKALTAQGGQGDQLKNWEVVMALGLSLICTLAVCLLYRFTHKSAGYSQNYVQTLVLMSLVTTLIMIVIGSNIARAFSLVGALSIIRFRNAMKETRDVGYIFFVMAIAMACGTRFYLVALLATGIIATVVLAMHIFDFGSRGGGAEQLLTVQVPPGRDPENTLKPALDKLFDGYSLVSVESGRQGLYTLAVLSVRPRRGVVAHQVLTEIAKLNDNLKVAYNYGSGVDEV
jgi:hypothetical protein